MHDFYESKEQCLVDIMANTDAPYRVAVLAAKYVYEEGWGYNNHLSVPRGVSISPNFNADDPIIIHLTKESQKSHGVW